MFKKILLVILLGVTVAGMTGCTKSPTIIVNNDPNFVLFQDSSVVISTIHGWGSGTFVAPNLILTALHVVPEGMKNSEFMIEDMYGEQFRVVEIMRDKDSDIALVTVNARHVFIPIGSSDKLHVGDTIFAVGTPIMMNFNFNVTKGIVSGLHRYVGKWLNVFNIDAFTGPGVSGGAIIHNNRLVGMVVGGLTSDGQSLGICETTANIDENLFEVILKAMETK
jgi:S1-C subfamily serine protease